MHRGRCVRCMASLPTRSFLSRHLGSGEGARAEMLSAVGVPSLEELMRETVPENIREEFSSFVGRAVAAGLTEKPRSESSVLAQMKELGQLNVKARSFIGMGYHGTVMPSVIRRCVLTNPAWYTAYTPYQAEISQGRLEALLTFQTVATELTGMQVANASLLDEATAAAEAMVMTWRANENNSDIFVVSDRVHPQTVAVLRSRAKPLGIQVELVADIYAHVSNNNVCFFGVLLQVPDTDGSLPSYATALRDLTARVHLIGGLAIAACDPMALTLMEPIEKSGFDVAVGSMQRFGVPIGFGGPHAAYMATSEKHLRKMPGRLIGVSKDAEGNRALRMTLQTREQHIRKEKATSNICTAQALLASLNAFYCIYHGPSGLVQIAERIHGIAGKFFNGVVESGFCVANTNGTFFDTVTVILESAEKAQAIAEDLKHSSGCLVRCQGNKISVSFDETHDETDLELLLKKFSTKPRGEQNCLVVAANGIPSCMRRLEPFMQQKVFHCVRTETEMMRYLKTLQEKDLALDRSMIPLGSCTMKLNPAVTMEGILMEEFSDIHPFAPDTHNKGYRILLVQLQQFLAAITALDAVSLQPNSGASGECAGLLVVKAYLDSIEQKHRNLALIPRSAHGTNPASAALAGLRVVALETDKETGCIDMIHLREILRERGNHVAVLMVTYPSTHGVFEENIKELCQLVHDSGAQVYMDGANMNAQVGVTAPGIIGADVCHLNLHKTFAIPHGGGGPGAGPICVKSHLSQFLPENITHPSCSLSPVVVSGSPFGSASILTISWAFISLLGAEGLQASTKNAVLNANYMMSKLKKAFPVKFVSKSSGRCAHEFIVDVRQFLKSAEVTEEDIAKRLMDYGFHAPTVSWPVPHSLMIEPTESESKEELDRFCDSMLSILAEIKLIENGKSKPDDNPLKNAPHTMRSVCNDNWTRSYSRQTAAFPADWLKKPGAPKFWPAVARVDNAYGDKNPVCTWDE